MSTREWQNWTSCIVYVLSLCLTIDMKSVSFFLLKSFVCCLWGSIVLSSFCLWQKLLISEVYFDGTDEWIEIANIWWQDFQGDITLVGVKSSDLTVSVDIPVWWVMLLGDKMDIITISVSSINDLWFSLTDTSALSIQLLIDNVVIDIFDVDQLQVEAINNTKSSIEKDCVANICVYNWSSGSVGVIPWFFASPGTYVFELEDISSGTWSTTTIWTWSISWSWQVSTWSIDVSTWSVGSWWVMTWWVDIGTWTSSSWSWGSQTMTWSNWGTGTTSWTWQSMTGNTSNGSGDMSTWDTTPNPPTNFGRGDIRLIEIHANDTQVLEEYIIIESAISYTWPLRFVWLGQWDAEKVANVSLSPGDRLLITDSIAHISPDEQWYTFPSITLTNGGESLQLFIDTILVDSVHYTWSEEGQVCVFTQTRDWVREFSTHTSSSVQLSTEGSIDCTITAEALEMNEDEQVVYRLNIPNIDPLYCGPRYTSQWMIDDIWQYGCSLTTVLWRGQHHITTTIRTQTNVLCSSSLVVYNHLWWTWDVCSSGTWTISHSGAIVEIQEIYPRDTDQFSEYIELLALHQYQWPLTIGWLGHGGANKTIEISVNNGERFIITDGTWSLSYDTKTYILPSISLTNWWEELSIYGQDGQVVDMIVYTEGIDGRALYYTTTSWSFDEFFTSDIPTPGFSYNQVAFLLETGTEDLVTSCAIRLQHTKPLFAGNKINLIAQIDGKDIQNSSTKYTCERDVAWSSYVFNEWCNPSYYDYDIEGVHRVGVRITDTSTNKICQTSLDINYPTKSGGAWSTTSSGDTYYQKLYKKRKGRFEILKKDVKSLGYSVATSGYITTALLDTWGEGEVLSGIISIERVLPNPAGSDIDAEELILKNLSDEAISLVGYKIYNGTSRKKLPEVILPTRQNTTIVWSLGLTNRASCIQLQYEDVTYDVFCYPQASDDQWFDTSLAWLETQTQAGLSSLKNIKLKLGSDQACIFFNKESVLCKGLKYTNDDVKLWKKDAKKYVTATKHIEQEKERANNRRAKYKDQVAKRKRDEEYLKWRIAKEKSSASSYRTQSRIHSDFANLMIGELQLNWSPVFYGSNLADYTYAYRDLIRMVKSNMDMYDYHGLEVPVEQVEAILTLEYGEKLPLVDTDVSSVYQKVMSETQGTLASFQQNLTKRRWIDKRISKTNQ